MPQQIQKAIKFSIKGNKTFFFCLHSDNEICFQNSGDRERNNFISAASRKAIVKISRTQLPISHRLRLFLVMNFFGVSVPSCADNARPAISTTRSMNPLWRKNDTKSPPVVAIECDPLVGNLKEIKPGCNRTDQHNRVILQAKYNIVCFELSVDFSIWYLENWFKWSLRKLQRLLGLRSHRLFTGERVKDLNFNPEKFCFFATSTK